MVDDLNTIRNHSQCFGAGGGAAGSTKHTSLVFQLDLFSFSTDRYRRFYPQQLSSAHQASLCCFIQTHLFPSQISNSFQYQPLGILLSGISLIVIRSHPHIVWITHSHTSSATTFGFIPHVLVSVCLDFPISDSYPQTHACVGFFLLPRPIR